MNDLAWMEAAFVSARPQALAALLRYFRDLDIAEEAFQEACLRALQKWPLNGPPRDPAAWLIMVGRNFAVDQVRHQRRNQALPDEAAISDLDDAEQSLAERLDHSHYRDDLLRLLFTCCPPDLPATQQIALALRIVSGLSVKEIAKAFLVSESAMEQRITRAKRQVSNTHTPFEAPGAVERSERLGAVATMLYLLFNEGYSASAGDAQIRQPLCDEAIRLTRLLLHLFPSVPEIMGLLSLMLLQHARSAARLDAQGQIVLLDQQDRSRWNREWIDEGLAMLNKALRHQQLGIWQVQAAIAAEHARASSATHTNWPQIAQWYEYLEQLQPSPIVRLNRAVAVSKTQGAQAALTLIEPLADALSGYFHYFGVVGYLQQQLGNLEAARVAFDRAIALAHTPAEAAHIRQQLDNLRE